MNNYNVNFENQIDSPAFNPVNPVDAVNLLATSKRWEELSPSEKKKTDSMRYSLETLEPNEPKRNKILCSLQLFMQQEGISFAKYSKENQSALMAAVLRIGVPISKDTVYPRAHYINGKQVLIIQDNYLFLQNMVLQHLGAQALIIDVVYNKELVYLKEQGIKDFIGKDTVIPLYELDKECNFEDIAFIQLAVTFKDKTPEYKTVYSKEKLMKRLGTTTRGGMIWGGKGLDINFHDHAKTEMLKKTAIRAFAKERFGGALDVIRTIDIEQFKMLESVNNVPRET